MGVDGAAAAAARAAAEARRRAEEARKRAETARQNAAKAQKTASAAKKTAATQANKVKSLREQAQNLQKAIKAKKAAPAAGKKLDKTLAAERAKQKTDDTRASRLQKDVDDANAAARKRGEDAVRTQRAAEEAAKTSRLSEKAKNLGEDYAQRAISDAQKSLGKKLSDVPPEQAQRALTEAMKNSPVLRQEAQQAEVMRKLTGTAPLIGNPQLPGAEANQELQSALKGENSAAGKLGSAFGDEVRANFREALGPNSTKVLNDGEVNRAIDATSRTAGKNLADERVQDAGAQVEKALDGKGEDALSSKLKAALGKPDARAEVGKLEGALNQKLDPRIDAAQKRIDSLRTDGDSKKLADGLNDELRKLPKSERADFLRQNSAVVRDISDSAVSTLDSDEKKDLVKSLGNIADATGPEGNKVVAQNFVQSIKDGAKNNRLFGVGLDEALGNAVGDGVGIGFARQTLDGLKGNEDLKPLRGAFADQTAKGIETFRKDFQGARSEYARVDNALNRYVAGFSDAMTPEQQQKAIAAFKARPENKAIYEKYERLKADGGRSLDDLNAMRTDPTLGDSMRTETGKALAYTSEFADTPEGQAQVRQALIDRGQGKPSFLDQLDSVYSQVKDYKGYADQAKTIADGVQQAMVKSISDQVVSSAAEGNPEARDLLAGLRRSSDVLNVSEKELGKSTDALEKVLAAPNQEARDAAVKELSKSFKGKGGALDPDGAAGKVIGGLGIVFTAVSAGKTFANFDEAKLKDQVQAVSDTLGLAAKGASFGLKALSSSAELADAAGTASKVFGVGAKGLGIVSAAANGLAIADAFQNGNTADQISAIGSTVGSLLLEAPNPYVKIAGAIVVGASALVGAIWGSDPEAAARKQEKQERDGMVTFLTAGGIPKDAADKYADGGFGANTNVGPMLTQLAPFFGKTPKEFFSYLNKNPDVIEKFAVSDTGYTASANSWTATKEIYDGVQKGDYSDQQDYKVGRDWKLSNPRFDTTGGRGVDGYWEGGRHMGSLLDVAAQMKAQNQVPKDWEVQIPTRYRNGWDRSSYAPSSDTLTG